MYKSRLASAFILIFCLAASAPGAGPLQDQLASKWQRAQTLFYANSNLNEAEKVCKEILADQHVNATMRGNANGMLGQIYEQRSKVEEGNLSRALGYYEEAAADYPQNPLHHLRLAECYEKMDNDLRRAVLEYQKVVALGAGKKEVLEKLIKYFEENNQPANAFAYYDSLIKRVPTDTSIHYRYGMTLKNGGKLDHAKQEFNKALLADDKNWEAYVALGKLYEEEGDDGINKAYDIYGKAKGGNKRAEEGWNRMQSAIKSRDFINKTIGSVSSALADNDINGLTRIHVSLDSLQQQHSLNEEVTQKFKEVRKGLCDLWFQRAQSLYNNRQNLHDALTAFDLSFSYADSEPDRNRALEGKSNTQAELGVKKRIETVQKEAKKALDVIVSIRGKKLSEPEKKLKESKLREANEGFIAVSVVDPQLQTTVRSLQKSAEKESWYFWGLVAMDSSRWDEAKFYFAQAMKLDAGFLDVKTRYAEADTLIKLKFLWEKCNEADQKEKWVAVNFLLDEILSLTPKDTRAQSLAKKAEDKIDSRTMTRRWIVAIGCVISFGVIITLFILWRKEINKNEKAEIEEAQSILATLNASRPQGNPSIG